MVRCRIGVRVWQLFDLLILLLIDNMEYGAATRGNRERPSCIQGVACGGVGFVFFIHRGSISRSGSIGTGLGVFIHRIRR
jgi:hypothetical protein